MRWIRFAQRRAVQQRRRHQHARARHRLPRRDGLDRRSGRLDVRREQAERAPLPVRAPAPAVGRQHRLGHRPGGARSPASPASAAPLGGTGQGNAGFDFKQNITQVIDNFTYIRAAHSYKFGFDWQHIYDERTAAPQFALHLPVDRGVPGARRAARARSATRTMTQITGDLGVRHGHEHLTARSCRTTGRSRRPSRCSTASATTCTATRRASRTRRSPQTRSFNIDRTTSGPRVGVAWSVDRRRRCCARSTGIMYDQADSRRLRAGAAAVRVAAGAALHVQRHAPPARRAFPASGVGTGTLGEQSPWAVDPDFQVAHTWQANAQLERAFGSDFTGVGRLHVREGRRTCRSSPTSTSINPIGTLADGRPIYARGVNARRVWIRASITSTRCSRSATRRSSR